MKKEVQTVMRRKKNWIGHEQRSEGLKKDVMEGRLVGRRMRGRLRIVMFDELKEGSYVQMQRRAENREKWKVGCQGPVNRQSTNE